MFESSSGTMDLECNQNFCYNQEKILCSTHQRSFYPNTPFEYQHTHSVLPCCASFKRNYAQPHLRGKAYDYYKKDRETTKKKKKSAKARPLYELPSNEAEDFARWLDYKYDMYLLELDMLQSTCPALCNRTGNDGIKPPGNLNYIMKPKVITHNSSMLNIPVRTSNSSNKTAEYRNTNTTFVKSRPCDYSKNRSNIKVDFGAVKNRTTSNIPRNLQCPVTQDKSCVAFRPKAVHVGVQYDPPDMVPAHNPNSPTMCKYELCPEKETTLSELPSMIFVDQNQTNIRSEYPGSYYSKAQTDDASTHNDTSDELFEELHDVCTCEKLPSKDVRRDCNCKCGCINDTVQTSDVAIHLDEVLDKAVFVKVIHRAKDHNIS